MKQSQYVVHNRGLSQILFSTPWSVRSIFKHAIVVAYIALITIIVFDFNIFKAAMEGFVSSTTSGSVITTAENFAPHIAWDVLLIFLEVRLLRRSLKMLQTSNRNMWVFIPMSLLTLSFGIFIVVFLPGWMESKLIAQDNFINKFKELSVFVFIYMAVPAISILWSLANALNERNISPFVARANVLTSITMIFWIAVLGCATKLANILFLNKTTVDFDYHNPTQLSLMIVGIILLVVTISLSIWSQRDMRIKTNYKFFNKNIEQAIAVAMVLPLAIWLTSTFLSLRGNWMEYLFISLVAIVLICFASYAFIRKTEVGSPRVFMVVTSLTLTIIWMLKFFFEYFWDYQVTSPATLPFALIATTIVLSVIYWRSPMASKLIQFLVARFVKTLWIVVVASWLVSLIPASIAQLSPTISDVLDTLSESLNLALMALPILLLATTLLYWYITQWKIKSHITYKTKQKNKKDKNRNKKEAINA